MAVGRHLSWLSALLVAVAPVAAQTASPPLALVLTYADGRVSMSAVGANGFRAWTPLFPRIDGWREPPDAPAVTALNISAAQEGDGLRVRVSVLRGSAREIDERIAEVVVAIDSPVTIDALARVGVQPVTVAAARFSPPALRVPQMASRADGVDIEQIEPVLEPSPGYRVTVRNRTAAPVVAIAFDSAAAGRRALSGQHGDPSAVPLMAPGGSFTFRLGTASAPTTPRGDATAAALDEVVLAGVLFADGTMAGDQARMAPLAALHHRRLEALQPVLAILRASASPGTDPLAGVDRVRDAVAAMSSAADAMAIATMLRLVPGMNPWAGDGAGPAVSVGSQNVRARLLADLAQVRPSVTPDAARRWLGEALAACEAWNDRLRALAPAARP